MTTTRLLLGAALLAAAIPAAAQQPAPPPPAFAASNLGDKGVRDLAANCASCHGTRGRTAEGSAVPGLAGRPKDDIVRAMAEFRSGARPATLMHQIAKGYTEAETAAMADYFSKQK